MRGRGKGISFCINFALALKILFRASVKMQFLLDARSSEPLSIYFASDMTAWEQCRKGGKGAGASAWIQYPWRARSCQERKMPASAPNQ